MSYKQLKCLLKFANINQGEIVEFVNTTSKYA